MGHEAIVYGYIKGASWHIGDRFKWLHELNRDALAAVPDDANWPWVVRDTFALPADYPKGVYRRQIIHFGLSLKDDPHDAALWGVWFDKFERVLRQLYWCSAIAHFTTDFELPWIAEWLPTDESIRLLYQDPPEPISTFTRTIRFADSRQAELAGVQVPGRVRG